MALKIRVTPTREVEEAAREHVRKQMTALRRREILGLPTGVEPWVKNHCGTCQASFWEPDSHESWMCPTCTERAREIAEVEHEAKLAALRGQRELETV